MDRVALEQWKGREVARLLALVETERRYYQEIVATLPVGLAVVSKSGHVQSANRAFRQFFGLRPDDVGRRSLAQILPDSSLREYVERLTLRASDPPPVMVEVADRKLRVSVSPIRDWDDDSAVEALLVIEDLTGLSLQPAVTEVPALMWTADADDFEFTVVGGDPGIAHPGFASAGIVDSERERIVAFYREALTKPGRHTCEYPAKGPEGTTLWYRDVFAVMATAGQAKKASGVVVDITERHTAELAARQSGRLDAVTSLAKVLAHDINNPLMIVTGYTEDVMATLDPADPRRTDMAEIHGAAQRMASLSAGLLTFTKKLGGTPEEVVVASALAVGLPAGISLARVSSQLRAIAQPQHLAEIATVLHREMQSGGHLEISARKTRITERVAGAPEPGPYVEIVFGSPGCSALMFDGLLAGKEPGGPDLARVHAMVREWGGGIWQSPGEVHILLRGAEDAVAAVPPAEAAAPEPAVAAETPAAPPPEPPVPQARETILIVEDEGGIRALVRKILSRENYDVLEAGSPDEAVEIATRHQGRIHMLLTDMTLPQRNGRQLADQISRIIPGIRVVFVSGYSDDPSVYDREQLPPGSVFLQKPFTLGSLLKRVREVLDDKA